MKRLGGMTPRQRRTLAAYAILAGLVVAWSTPARAEETPPYRFDFGPGSVEAGFRQVLPATLYSDQLGYGFEPGAALEGVDGGGGTDALRGDCIASNRPFFFSVKVPAEGNYRVTVTLGDAKAESTTTIKAELRRLMIEKVHLAAGQFETVSFIVNVRTPVIAERDGILAGKVKLKEPRESVQEAWGWDDRLTLEFGNARPAVCGIEIAPVPDAATIFLLGDSTVCDQSREPYASWGQMFTRFFRDPVAVANHGESGETYRDAVARRRVDKILSVMQPGDLVVLEFGHNDQKQIAAGTGGPFTTFKDEIRRCVASVRRYGGVPVLVTPVERREFDAQGHIKPSLADYAEAVRQSAKELRTAFIDLNAMSRKFYEALGPEGSKAAFASPEPGKVDNTHHNNYGAYELAKCVAQRFKEIQFRASVYLAEDFQGFDPGHPDPVDAFAVPPTPLVASEKPLGN